MVNDKRKGIFFITLAALCFASMSLFMRLAGDVPILQKTFFRNLFPTLLAGGVILKNKQSFRPASPGNFSAVMARCCIGIFGTLGNLYALDHLLLADATMLNKLSPFFAVIASYFLLKEKISPLQAFSLMGAFFGALLIIKPSFFNLDFVPSLVGLVGGMCAGFSFTCVRFLGKRGETGSFLVFAFSAFCTLVTLPKVLLDFYPMTLQQFLFVSVAGLCATGGEYAVTAAYHFAPAREISVYDYSQVIFSALMGFFVFGDRPDFLSILGYFLICSMAILVFLHNTGRLPLKKQQT